MYPHRLNLFANIRTNNPKNGKEHFQKVYNFIHRH